MFEVFDHTADLGIRVRARRLEELFAEAGRALFSIIVENLDAVQPRDAMPVLVQESTLEYLFFDWLDTLLYLFDARKLLLCEFDVQVTESVSGSAEEVPSELAEAGDLSLRSRDPAATRLDRSGRMWRLTATVRGEPVDRTRHQLDHEVKAITYHGLKVQADADGWYAEVIVDI